MVIKKFQENASAVEKVGILKSSLIFKIATEEQEFEQIHRLNYETFVQEIPQHDQNSEQRLIDKFHAENTYFIALDGCQLVGMVALRSNRPFSLDQKLPSLDSYLPSNRKICEIRLLAVKKECRYSRICRGLIELLAETATEYGFDCAVISATTKQLKLYRHLGYIPFGPCVGQGEAVFQPMYILLESFEESWRERASIKRNANQKLINFLSGPVTISTEVEEDFKQLSLSHRSPKFVSDFQEVKTILRNLTQSENVEILLGSGTLANDVVAAYLAADSQPGLILSNGEFGERLVDHAFRWGLNFQTLREEWGAPFSPHAVRNFIETNPNAKWLWVVHCESSTGALNNLDYLKTICNQKKLKLCLDCVSTIGIIPIDLKGVSMATGVSGKGLASYAGLALVFYQQRIIAAQGKIPRYLDLQYYAEKNGVPFTHSSNLLYALKSALENVDWNKRYQEIEQLGNLLRTQLIEIGYQLVDTKAALSPGIITIELPSHIKSLQFGQHLENAGFLLGYRSEYLQQRNWIQICLMGKIEKSDVSALLSHLKHIFKNGACQ